MTTAALRLRRLLPEPGSVTAAEAVGDLAGREVVAINMVASVDGRIAIDGVSGGITAGPGDRALFHALRAHVDCVLVGTGTIAAEDYGPLVRDERWRAVRTGAGLGPEPAGAVLTRSGDVPRQAATLSGDVHVLTGADAEPAAAIAALRAHGHRSILCEGGPTINAALLAAGVVDELFVSIAPQLVGGAEAVRTMVGGAIGDPRVLTLLALLEHDGALFARYGLPRTG